MSLFILTRVSGLRKLKEQHWVQAFILLFPESDMLDFYKCMRNPVNQQTKENISDIE